MIDRRQFLKNAGIGTLVLLTGNEFFLNNTTTSGADPIPAGPGTESGPDLEIALDAVPSEVLILPGAPTRIWRFKARLLKGDPDRLIELPGSYLGPVIKARTGERIRIVFSNRLPEETIVHWHGLHVPAMMDGHPRYAIQPGRTYVYDFEIKNRAGTYWYHPHPHGRTGPQVYGGLAGLFLVSGPEERAAGLPSGEFDIPLVLQDRLFDTGNQLVYNAGHPMARMNGMLGNHILVNGQPDFVLPVSTRAYRLRLLNGSNSRIYRLAWDDGRPLVVIGTDGGLLHQPVQREYLFLGPGERVELYADFSEYPIGREVALASRPFGADGMMGRAVMGGASGLLPNGAGFTVMKIKTIRREKGRSKLPAVLSQIDRIEPKQATNLAYPRRFDLVMGHMRWTINGRTFQMESVADDETVMIGSNEVWEFNNVNGGMGMMGMMQQPHPIHLHGKQFRVLERLGVGHTGYVDEGWKDTVLLMPGESVRVLVRFEDYPGLFLYHCHNLEHEDMGMMRNYRVKT